MIKIANNYKEALNTIPELPGIYRMIDSRGTIIYIGKSKCLRKRVKSYFYAARKW
jgi:excinuclease ABC subunit C